MKMRKLLVVAASATLALAAGSAACAADMPVTYSGAPAVSAGRTEQRRAHRLSGLLDRRRRRLCLRVGQVRRLRFPFGRRPRAFRSLQRHDPQGRGRPRLHQPGSSRVGCLCADAGYHEGSLGGLYQGATAEATVGVGVGTNVLYGGTKGSIQLQPISLQGQVGLERCRHRHVDDAQLPRLSCVRSRLQGRFLLPARCPRPRRSRATARTRSVEYARAVIGRSGHRAERREQFPPDAVLVGATGRHRPVRGQAVRRDRSAR